MAVLLTGATGFLGTEVCAELLKTDEKTIYVLVRGRDEAEAAHRLRAAWYEIRELYQEIGGRIRPLCGDFTQADLGLSGETLQQLTGKLSRIYHIGAETGIQKSKEELMKVNRDGTANVLDFARKTDAGGSLRRFLYVSSAYTAGARSGRILETDPLPGQYRSYYEMSKARAEKLVTRSNLPYTICRPGMIVGHSENGRIRNFNTVYYVLRLLLQGKMQVLPLSSKQKLNLVPVDYAAGAVVKLSYLEEAENTCFHITPPEDKKPEAGELAEAVNIFAEKELKLSLPKTVFISMPLLKDVGAAHNKKTGEKEKSYFGNLAALMPYFYDDHVFDRTNTDRLLGEYKPDWRSFITPLMRYACRHNFLHRTGRNVFEQVLFRLKSKSAPISYYDVSKEGVRKTSGEEMLRRIERARRGLLKLGVRRGDKVALTGSNCSDYFSLDIAIGLCGAVSVPIYYTTPIEEIDLLLAKSGAGWLFVGDRRIMAGIDGLKSDVPLIAFFSALEMKPEKRTFLTWEEFLEGGELLEGGGEPVSMDPEDLATIRCTSGTTGEPKGVMFNAGQLAFMGQVMTALLPWKGKQEELRYLSFLPLSHVVEGILAAYAPYYLHSPVKYYYLNDFDYLTEALPRVRPTVFFSVPRFYEKLWQKIEENPLGKRYLALPDGLQKDMLGALLKKAVLKKAGIDRCSQLIVGSAPISRELLQKFRQLDIEVHNAYGQTEAPLITINRMGDNVIPSIGTPLPDTKVTAAADGELIVSGPQVCLGYYGLQTDAIRDGVLMTGDLGAIDGNGHVYLIGRKKEMIITSYGKNINCPKIEERLKNINGVSEAVLIGENRPYCTALLWMEEHADPAGLGSAIEEMNQKLSHPEQIRRWTVVKEPLSIQKGELTPNLKVKRKAVEEHFKNEIEELYKN